MLLAAAERGNESWETGRYVVTYKEGAGDQALQWMQSRGLRTADARDFDGQAVSLQDVGDADALAFPELGVAVVGGGAAVEERGISAQADIAADSPIEAIEPELFVFAIDSASEYLRGFSRAIETVARDLGGRNLGRAFDPQLGDLEEDALVAGATWGLAACKVPASARNGAGIKVAVLDTGLDLGHPDISGRPLVTQTFVGQPVQDLNGHGTHCIGTACGPVAPPGTTPRYGIGFAARIHAGKVLSNAGSGSQAQVLAGMNWAVANGCQVISMSLGSQAPVNAAYTAAGRQALARGCLIIAAAGNAASSTGAPANSPTIMSVASLDSNLSPSSFSNFGKVEIAAPGGNVFSSVPMPQRYGFKSGTSMATPHVAGCAALWAQTSPNLRGQALWAKLQQTARPLPFSSSRVGSGLVQAP